MFAADLSDVDASAVLDLADALDEHADRAETLRLRVALRWADLHGALDGVGGGGSSRCLPGAERLVPLGGDGTPAVAEFCPAELGARWRLSHGACAALIADALDLRHRLPRLWGLVQAGKLRPWAARRIAHVTRHASQAVAAHADRRVSLWAHCKTPGQLEGIAGAALIEADPATAQARADAAATSQGVWVGPSSDHGLRDIAIRTDAASAAWFDAAIDRVADGLGLLGDIESKDVRRAKAVGVLAQPQTALDLYDAVAERATGEPATGASSRMADPRPPATLYVHVDADVLAGQPGAATVEGIGPVTLRQAQAWLGRCDVTVRPVLDLNRQRPVDQHDPSADLREAVLLRSPVDCFPHATGTSRLRDLDHIVPYQPMSEGGSSGQTRLDNLAPLSRRSHRVKTHGRWKVWQIDNGVLLWQAPHGHCYLVDRDGTHQVADTRDTRTRAPASAPTLA
jgi:hypothetical protein